MHPTVGIQPEAAKTFGHLAAGLPSFCKVELMPYLLQQQQSDDTNDEVSEVKRRGAADGWSEVLLNRRRSPAELLVRNLAAQDLERRDERNYSGCFGSVPILGSRHAGLPSTFAQVSGGHSELPVGALRGCDEAVDCHRAGVDRRVRRCLVHICCCLGFRRFCSSNLRTRGRWRRTSSTGCAKRLPRR